MTNGIGLVVAAQDSVNYKMGDYISRHKLPMTWGAKMTLPNFVILEVADAQMEDADPLFSVIYKYYRYEIVSQNAQGYRCKLTIDPDCVSQSGINSDIHEELETYLLGHPDYEISIVSQTATSMTADVAKPADLDALKDDINILLDTHITPSKFYLRQVALDDVISQGGLVVTDMATVQSNTRNKLDD